MFVWELLADLLVRFVEVVVSVVCGESKVWRNGFVHLRGKAKKKKPQFLILIVVTMSYVLCALCYGVLGILPLLAVQHLGCTDLELRLS